MGNASYRITASLALVLGAVGCGSSESFSIEPPSSDGGADATSEGGTDATNEADSTQDTGIVGDAAPDACAPGLGDCDENPATGCEVDLTTNPDHCGSCGAPCAAAAHADATCDQGTCAIECQDGFGDCDDDPANGCEVELGSDITHCGTCSNVCPTAASADATCEDGACSFTCHPGSADCESAADGCETDLLSLDNCGSCGSICGTNNANAVCTTSGCALTCNAGFADCNAIAADGCEADFATDSANCGWCGHNCLSSACTDGLCEPVALAIEQRGVSELEVDDVSVFWTATLAATVNKVPKIGGSVIPIIQSGRRQLALSDTHVYVGKTGDQATEIFRMAKSGFGGEQSVVSGIGAFDFVLDGTKLYWIDQTQAVMSFETGGGTPVTLFDQLQQCWRITFNATQLVWGCANGFIWAGQKQGGASTQVASGAGIPNDLKADSTHVYWADVEGRIVRAPLAGGSAEVLASSLSHPYAIALDADDVYWVDLVDGRVRSVPKAGGDTHLLAQGLVALTSIAVDDESVYFAEFGENQDGAIWRVAK